MGEWANAGLLAACARFARPGSKPTGRSATFVSPGSRAPDGCLFEIDMGTLTRRRFARNVQAFETALEDEVFRRHFKRDDFAVLVLTQSRRRAEALRHQPHGPWRPPR